MAINGMDVSHYPGDANMAWLRANGAFRVTGFYLTHWPMKPDKSWLKKRQTLAGLGWGFLPTYVGLQSGSAGLNAQNGARDAGEAVNLMGQAGFPTSSVIYLDIEDGGTPAAAFDAYISAWVAAVAKLKFTPAFYCSHNLIAWARRKSDIVWSFRVPEGTNGETYDPTNLPAAKIDKNCIATQYRQEIKLKGLTIPPSVDKGIDLDLCQVPDPSNFAAVHHALGLG